ncbi:hypothetical protein NUU61_006054 [Penicillium alfredii]|uniref:Uncharacterized protein n=1 Tax=Penicillium alfredii TaxID=1506179 RepID=A0A9W9K2Y6_9EURO|nr:uncharacterized protein NUU61_006054 [Penicillium alfredii]KAJ5091184.1 hypothetical protein NUU61_006054 [Penicillium alfredii]
MRSLSPLGVFVYLVTTSYGSSVPSCTITETSSCTPSTSYGVNNAGMTTATFTTPACSMITACSGSDMPAPGAVKPRGRQHQTEIAICSPYKLRIASARSITAEGPALWDQLKGAYIVPLKEDQCAVPELTVFPDWDKLTKKTHFDEKKSKYGAMGTNNPPYVTTEHVYELQILPAFLVSLIENNKISCEDLNDKLFPPGSDDNLAQDLFNQLPSWDHPEFIVLDNLVNDWKGNMFGGELSQRGKLKEKIKGLYHVAMVYDMLNMEDVYTKFKTTNARIYKYLRDEFDGPPNSDCPGLAPQGGWAPAYSSFMESYVPSRLNHASNVMSIRYSSATENKKATPEETAALSQLTKRYPIASWTADMSNLLSWPAKHGATQAAYTPAPTATAAAK